MSKANPPALKLWVASILHRIPPGQNDIKDKVRGILTSYIKNIQASGQMWTYDWSTCEIQEVEELLAKQPPKPRKRKASPQPDPDKNPVAIQPVIQSSQGKKKSYAEVLEAKRTPVVIGAPVVKKLSPQQPSPKKIKGFNTTQQALELRQQRFSKHIEPVVKSDFGPAKKHQSHLHFSDQKTAVVGTSTQLEKRYLRLTSAPDPSTVRPKQMLLKSFKHVIQKWNSGQKEEDDYLWICDQLKSIRQDLTVQMIRDQFTVEVYETHGRIAIQQKDFGEYNQCQGQLDQLYEQLQAGCIQEFKAYRLLYFVLTDNKGGISQFLDDLDQTSAEVQHALDVRCAVATGNFRQVFKLFKSAPNLNGLVMLGFLDRERIKALQVLGSSYRTLQIDWIVQLLAFDSKDQLLSFSEEKELQVNLV